MFDRFLLGLAACVPGAQGALITAPGEVGAVVRESLSNGFSRLGFELLASPHASAPSLQIRVRTLEYLASKPGFGIPWNIAIIAEAQADVYKGPGQPYFGLIFNKTFTSRGEYIRAYAPAASWSEEKIDFVLSDLIGKILGDLKLLAALK